MAGGSQAARVVFLGPPGAGKGTQAARLASHLCVPRVSTGDMLRDAIAEGTDLGRQAKPLMERGELVPDSLLIGIIGERLGKPDCTLGYILDGFPRTVVQAQGFEQMVDPAASDGLVVFDMQVPRAELLRRLSGRRWCPQCQATYHVHYKLPRTADTCDHDGAALIQREDDKVTAVERRLAEYDARTAPLIDYYHGRARFLAVDGNQAPDTVFGLLRNFVGRA